MIRGKIFSRAALLYALFLLLIASCVNPYKHLGNRPPLTAQDSAALLARCVAISPLDTTITHFIPQEPALPDSSSYFKAFADSLGKKKQLVSDSLLIKYKDTCTSVPYLYEDGFNTGFDVGYYESKSASETKYNKSSRITDSLHQLEIAKLKAAYNTRLIAAANLEGIANAKAEKYRLKYENWQKAFIYASGAAALFLIISILLWKFRRQQRAANNIINDVKDLK